MPLETLKCHIHLLDMGTGMAALAGILKERAIGGPAVSTSTSPRREHPARGFGNPAAKRLRPKTWFRLLT